MDTHAFASLAHVRILLVPVGTIPQSTFEKYAAEIRSFDCIRLGDIPADTKDYRARFMPNPLSTGHLQLSFPTHPPPLSHLQLSLLRPSHFPLAVIGVAACSQTDSLGSILAHFNAYLSDLFPAGGIFPLAKNCFVFEESDGITNLNLGDNLPGLVVIPSMMGNKKLYIGTLLADLCSHILGELGVVIQALESPLGNEYLNSSLMPTMPPLSDIPSSLDSKRDVLPSLPSHNSQPDMARSGLTISAPQLKRNSSSGPNFRQSTLNIPPPPKKRLSGIGVSSPHGRLFKVLGDFFLLSGRTEDALIWYTEALLLFKTSQDFAWHAATLEGMATVGIVDAWSAGHGLHSSTTATKEPWTDVSEKLTQAAALYFKSPTSDGEQNLPLLTYLYCCCILRQSSLLFAIWSAKGWGPLAFTTMLQPGPAPYLPPTLAYEEGGWITQERLSSISGVPRSSISACLAQLHGPWLLHLGARERIVILEAMASLYACLGYKRKEAYVLREVLGCILDLVVCGREEDGFSTISGSTSTPGLGIQGNNSSRGTVGVRQNESIDGNESVLKLLKYVCKVLGINLEAVRLMDSDSPAGVTGLDRHAVATGDEFDDLNVTSENYGWPELQVGVVREAVAVAEALPDFLAVAQFALSSLKSLQDVLSSGDQHHLYSTSSRALTTARRRGDTRCVEYWSGKPVVSIAVSPLPLIRLPIETPISVLQRRSVDAAPILTGTDPFLYNPRKAAAAQGRTLVVQNETLEFVITLQNPFVFDLELQELSLSTSGISFECQPARVLLPSNSYHQVVLVGKAAQTGILVVRGCIVQTPGATPREFLLPISSDEEEERIARRRGTLACETDRSKYSGMEGLPWERHTKRASAQVKSAANAKPPRFLECKVVPEQPLLRIRRTSLTHGALMLYDGELSTIRITLENVPSLPIDYLRLVFDDSTIAPAQQALTEGDLSVFDTYETEYGLIHQPVFSWKKEEGRDISIPPGQKLTLTVTCFGKVGCTNGAIHFSYSYARRPQLNLDAPPEVFHTRQLSYPVMVTVYHMLECHGMDILPFHNSGAQVEDAINSRSHSRRQDLAVDADSDWCLFSIEVRNTYGLPFEVTFERNQEDAPHATTSTTVPPGSMSRIVIPVQKFLLTEEQLSKPIPTLSDRQFVVNKSKISEAESKAQRELFWYREELLKCVRGHWREVGGTRSGDLSLRRQRMTLPMLDTLRLEQARVHMSLISHNSGEPIVHEGGRCHPQANEFVSLRTRVTNLTPSPLVFTMDLTMEPAEHVIFEGVLAGLSLGRLESGESREVETPLCFLAYGRFEVVADVRTFGIAQPHNKAGLGQLTAIVRPDSSEP